MCCAISVNDAKIVRTFAVISCMYLSPRIISDYVLPNWVLRKVSLKINHANITAVLKLFVVGTFAEKRGNLGSLEPSS